MALRVPHKDLILLPSCLTRSDKHIVAGVSKHNKLWSALSNSSTPDKLETHAAAFQVFQIVELIVTLSSPTAPEVYFPKLQTPVSRAGPALDHDEEMNDVLLRVGKLWVMMMMKGLLPYYYCVVALAHSRGSRQQTLVAFTFYQVMSGFTPRQSRMTCWSGPLLSACHRVAERSQRWSSNTAASKRFGLGPLKAELPLILQQPNQRVSLLYQIASSDEFRSHLLTKHPKAQKINHKAFFFISIWSPHSQLLQATCLILSVFHSNTTVITSWKHVLMPVFGDSTRIKPSYQTNQIHAPRDETTLLWKHWKDAVCCAGDTFQLCVRNITQTKNAVFRSTFVDNLLSLLNYNLFQF